MKWHRRNQGYSTGTGLNHEFSSGSSLNVHVLLSFFLFQAVVEGSLAAGYAIGPAIGSIIFKVGVSATLSWDWRFMLFRGFRFLCVTDFNDRQKIGMFTHAPAFNILNYLLFEESPMCRELEEPKLKSIQIKIIRKNALFPKNMCLKLNVSSYYINIYQWL